MAFFRVKITLKYFIQLGQQHMTLTPSPSPPLPAIREIQSSPEPPGFSHTSTESFRVQRNWEPQLSQQTMLKTRKESGIATRKNLSAVMQFGPQNSLAGSSRSQKFLIIFKSFKNFIYILLNSESRILVYKKIVITIKTNYLSRLAQHAVTGVARHLVFETFTTNNLKFYLFLDILSDKLSIEDPRHVISLLHYNMYYI